MREKGREPIQYSRALLNKKSGFTLIEAVAVTFIMLVLCAAIFECLKIGQYSTSINSNKIHLQSYLRNILELISRDVRQTDIIEINSNNPSVDHIKFRKVIGIDDTSGQYAVDSKYIEYTYDHDSRLLTRSETAAPVVTSVFKNITQSPFYTAPGVPLVSTPGVAGNILIAKKLYIVIAGEREVRNSSALNFTLTQEVKIRNE